MLNKIDHIGVTVFDLDKSVERHKKLFNINVKFIETLENLSIRIAFIPVGEVMLELIEPLIPGQGSVAAFLDKHGEGFHHIAYRVENLKELLVTMKQAGIGLRDDTPRPGGGGAWIAFLKPEETNNVLTELVEREKDL